MKHKLLSRILTRREQLSSSQIGFLLAGTLLLKNLLGLTAQMVVAREFGAQAYTDAYFLSLNLPQILGDFLLGGILLFSIVPVSLQIRESHGQESQSQFHLSILVSVLVIGGLLSLSYAAWADLIIPFFAPGFSSEIQVDAVRMARTLSPVLACWALSGFFAGLFTIYRQFLSAVFVTMIYSLTMIAFCLFGQKVWGEERLIWGTLAGVLLQAVFSLIRLAKSKPFAFGSLPHDVWIKNLSKMRDLVLPMTLPVLFNGIFSLQQKAYASKSLAGGVSWLNYANLLYLTAGLLVLGAFQTILYPKFADQAAKKEFAKNQDLFLRSIRFVLFTGIPITIFFILLRKPLVSVFLERGIFMRQDSFETGSVLAWMLIGFSAHSCVQISMRLAFAESQPWDYVRASLGGTLVGLIANPLLFHAMGIRGMGLAYALISIATWHFMAFSYAGERLSGIFRSFYLWMSQFLALSLIPGLAVAFLNRWMQYRWDLWNDVARALTLGGVFFVGALIYLVLGSLFRIPESGLIGELFSLKRWRGQHG